MKTEDAIAFVGKLREAASKERSGLNIGAAMVHDNDDPAAASLLVEILSKVGVNANLITADEQGIHWNAIRQAARIIKQLSERSPHGDANFNFGAIAMMKPYGPYYPGSYHLGKGHAFAIAMEGAEVVGDVFRQYRDPVEAEKHLSAALDAYTKQVEAVAMQLAKTTGWTYEGIDATPAPIGDRSIATAIEYFLDAPFGSVGTETASGIITRAVQSTTVKRTGYSGLMIPIMEDNVLAKRWSEGTFTLDSILAWCQMCDELRATVNMLLLSCEIQCKFSNGPSRMKLTRDIHSLSTFKRDTAKLVRQMKKTKEPVILTVNGKAELVVQDAESYEKLLEAKDRMDALDGIKRGLESMKRREGKPAGTFFTEFFAEKQIPERE